MDKFATKILKATVYRSMSSLLKFAGFLKNVSIILLTVALFLVYAFIHEPAGLWFDEKGRQVLSIPKNSFFYYSLLAGLASNIIFHLFKTIYLNPFKRSNPLSGNKISVTMLVWWQFLIMSVNLFLMGLIVFTGFANNAGNYSFSSITFIPVLGISPLVITLLAFPVMYFFSLKQAGNHAV